MYIRKCPVTLPCAGEWVDFLGMKDSAKYVGTPQSVAIRIPDCSVTTHLIDLVSGQSTLIPAALVTRPRHSPVEGAGLVSVSSTQVFWLREGRGTVRGWSTLSALLAYHLSSLFSFLNEVRILACSDRFGE